MSKQRKGKRPRPARWRGWLVAAVLTAVWLGLGLLPGLRAGWVWLGRAAIFFIGAAALWFGYDPAESDEGV